MKANDAHSFYIEGGADYTSNPYLMAIIRLLKLYSPLRYLIFGSSFFVEFFTFLYLLNRVTLLLGGMALWMMHFMIANVMLLKYISFVYERY